MPRSRPRRERSSRAGQLGDVGDDELPGHRRRRGAHVGGEVAERRVLLVPDRGDDGDRAGRDRPDEPLVAEREQILEAAAAAREDDHVHAGLLAERPQRVDDPAGGPRALHVRLGDEHVRRGEAPLDRGEDVALRGGVVAGDEPDPARQERQRALALGGEQALGGELRLEALEGREVGAEPETLDRQGAQAEVAALGEELRAPVDVHPLAVGELEPERVELPALHRHPDAGAVGGILERQEDARPALVAAQLGHLALDPDRRQPPEPLRDAPVERGDRVDGAVVVGKRLDLAHGASLLGERAEKSVAATDLRGRGS